MAENKSKKELEKEIFKFSALRVWSDIFPVVLDLEKILGDKPKENSPASQCGVNSAIKSGPRLQSGMSESNIKRLFEVTRELLECLVSGYYKYHLVDKYLAYAKAKECTATALFLVYRLGFERVLEKEKVLDFGARLAECVMLMSSLIRNLENKMKRMDEAKWMSERLKNER